MGFLAGKRISVTEMLSNRSIAYGIARACRRDDIRPLLHDQRIADPRVRLA